MLIFFNDFGHNFKKNIEDIVMSVNQNSNKCFVQDVRICKYIEGGVLYEERTTRDYMSCGVEYNETTDRKKLFDVAELIEKD